MSRGASFQQDFSIAKICPAPPRLPARLLNPIRLPACLTASQPFSDDLLNNEATQGARWALWLQPPREPKKGPVGGAVASTVWCVYALIDNDFEVVRA